ncbi:hypothetical protein PoB_000303700 [Plakobranchus ocellatus]|uniref:Uncharacterized protein n=1 Tax=Plakobranchus ocellatus TaxID=259542 RepID=A0AAV3Y188_9GAST|nr:hypothetical protein PoB_000303700 [Plakobranchus ocellatus]
MNSLSNHIYDQNNAALLGVRESHLTEEPTSAITETASISVGDGDVHQHNQGLSGAAIARPRGDRLTSFSAPDPTLFSPHGAVNGDVSIATAVRIPPADPRKSQARERGTTGSRISRADSDDNDDDNEHDDDDIDPDGEDDGQIPEVKDLVPPVERLFSQKSAIKPASVSGGSSADNRASRGSSSKQPAQQQQQQQQQKGKPRTLFPVSAAANNRARSVQHEDILDLTRVMAVCEIVIFGPQAFSELPGKHPSLMST